MVQLNQTYAVSEMPEMEDFTPLVPGTYSSVIVGSEMKRNSKDTGEYLELEIHITEGKYKGRKLYERLNIDNPNQVAVEIAFKIFGSLCKAVGLEEIGDSNQLHNMPFLMDVDIEEGSEFKDKVTGEMKMGSPQNRIKKYHAFVQNGGSQPRPAVAVAPAEGEQNVSDSSPAEASSGAAPWNR